MKFNYSVLKSNFASGLVVFLVALPLCLGIAIASGAPPLAGVISGIIGGAILSFISNSHISVSGPAAGLTAIVLAGITDLNSYELFLVAVFIAGLIQLGLGFLKAGSISNYFPNNVIEGMLAGIGVIIILKQIPHAIGFDKENMAQEETIFEHGFHPIDYLTTLSQSVHYGAVCLFFISIIILLLWDKFKMQSKFKYLPGALIAVVVSILIDEFLFKNKPLFNVEQSHLVTLPIIKSLEDIKNSFSFPNFSGLMNIKVWTIGATIAIVASIETLLCIDASDKMDKMKRITDTNLELKAQGIGNMISGLLGGLPMTSVVVRSSANANSGATHKSSSIIHGLLLLISLVFVPFLLNKIPLATLAAVLILVGYKLANPSVIKKFLKKGHYQFIPFVVTMICVVVLDLLKGVGLGMIISLGYVLYQNMKNQYYYSGKELDSADVVQLTLAEEVSFLNKASIKNTLRNLSSNTKIVIDATNTKYIATDVLELIQDFTNHTSKDKKIEVELKGFKTEYNDESDKSLITILHKKTI